MLPFFFFFRGNFDMTPAAELLHYALDASINMRRSLHHVLLPEFTGAALSPSRRREDCDALLNALQILAREDRSKASTLTCALLALTDIEHGSTANVIAKLERNLLGDTSDKMPRVSQLPVVLDTLGAFKGAKQGDAFRGVVDSLLSLPLPLVATAFNKDQLIALRDIVAFVNATGLREGNASAEELALPHTHD